MKRERMVLCAVCFCAIAESESALTPDGRRACAEFEACTGRTHPIPPLHYPDHATARALRLAVLAYVPTMPRKPLQTYALPYIAPEEC